MRRTGRDDTPSMPLINSILPEPPQPSVARPREQRADRHAALPLRRVSFAQHAVLAAAVASDAQEPRRKGAQRQIQEPRRA
jgi:hypothetical protein